MSLKYKHKTLLTNQYKISPIAICQMPPKSLAKAKGVAMPRVQTKDLRIQFVVAW
jgi:hypothetical protein